VGISNRAIIYIIGHELTINDQFHLQSEEKAERALRLSQDKQGRGLTLREQGVCEGSEPEVQPAQHIQNRGREEAESEDAHRGRKAEGAPAKGVRRNVAQDGRHE
jgi:hypothetical protein